MSGRSAIVARLSTALVVLTGCGLEPVTSDVTVDGVPITVDDAVPSSDPQAMESTSAVTSAVTSSPTTSTVTPQIVSEPPSTTQRDSRPLALDVLSSIPLLRERGDGYDRELFDHWITIGGCSTRENVLIRDSLTPAQVDPFGCRVVAGDWLSPYDGATWENPADIDIDHVVALKEAWDSGAWAWNAQQRRTFANDVSDRRSLRAVTDDVNRAKGDKDPSNWMPPMRSAWCTYLGDWIAIKARWQLAMDESEAGRIRNLLSRECSDWRIEPWSPPPVSVGPAVNPAG